MPPVEQRRRNARGQGARLRTEIIEASQRLIDRGTELLTLRAVARETGVAGPSIYDHFAGVEAIEDDLVAVCFDDLTARLRAADASAADPVARLDAICDAYVAYGAAFPHRYALLYRTVRTRERKAATGNRGAVALGVLVDGIAACAEAGRSSSVDHYVDAVSVWTVLHGLTTLRASRPDFPALHADATLRGMVRRQAGITPA
jgi:AcrR family transcriptional regulator